MLCNIKPVPFHESDKHIFAKIPGGGVFPDPRSPPLDPPMNVQSDLDGLFLSTKPDPLSLTIPKQVLVFMFLQYRSFENTVEKGEIVRNEQFCHFHQVQNCRLQTFSESKICRLGKGQADCVIANILNSAGIRHNSADSVPTSNLVCIKEHSAYFC